MTITTSAVARGTVRAWLARHSLWVAMLLWAVGIALAIAGVILLELNQATLAAHPGLSLFPLQITSGLPYLVLGGLIFARRPANPLGWLIGAAGLAGVMAYFCYQYAVFTLLTRPGALPFGDAAAWLYNGVWGLPIFFYPLFIILFPTGTAPSRGWRWVVWFDCAIIAWITLLLPVGAGSMQGIDLLEAAAYPNWVNAFVGASFGIFLLGGLLVSLAGAIVRYRRAPSGDRAQIRWLLYAVVCLIVLNLLSSTVFADTMLGNDPTALIAGPSIFFLFLPIAIGVSIFRYHLFDIDRLINRTIVYGLLTLAVVGIYFGGVVVLQTLLKPLTGAGNDLAVVATTLLVAALFLPLRRRVQGFIDRRFYRRKYDAAQVVAAFGETVRDEVELGKLTGRLVEVVDEAMQPAHRSLWLRVVASVNHSGTDQGIQP